MTEAAKHWIVGEWVDSASALVAESLNPATGRLHGVEGLAEFLETKHISWTMNP